MKKTITILGIIVILILLAVVFIGSGNNKNTSEDVIRVGYIIYPPLLEKDATTGELSGVSYDIVEKVAGELGLETDWVEEVGWGTALEGLKTNRYDILGTQMWPNEAREKVAVFSVAPMDSVIYPYIKKGDTRFRNASLETFNSEEYTLTTLDGDIAVFIAQEDYPKATLLALPQLSSYAEVFLNVVQNKADFTLTEPSASADFLASHPNTIERVGNKPVRSFGNSFAFDKGNKDLLKKWNNALKKVMNNGETKNILEKHGVSSYYGIN